MKILGFNITRKETPEAAPVSNRSFDAPIAGPSFSGLFKPSTLQNVMMSGELTPVSCVLSEKGKRLMGQAREVATSSPFINSFMGSFLGNVIGPSGFSNNIQNESVKARWDAWCEEVDLEGESDLRTFLEYIVRSWVVDGDGIAVAYHNKEGLRLKWVDAAILDHDYNRPRVNGENMIVNGIEVDDHGRKLKYHFQNQVGLMPFEYYSVTARGNAKVVQSGNVLHLYTRQFPSQVRGITSLAPVMGLIGHMNKYMQAEVTAKHYSASKFALLSQRNTGDVGEDWDTEQPDNKHSVEAKHRAQNIATFDSGMIDILPENFDLLSWDAQHNQAVDAFMSQLMQVIAKGLGMSYATFTGDLSKVNYSSIRAGSIEERTVFANVQKFIIRRFLNPLYKMWCESENVIYETNKPEFVGRKWSYVNPEQEIKAATAENELGVRSKADIIRARGEDPETVFAEIAAEQPVEPTPPTMETPPNETEQPAPMAEEQPTEAPEQQTDTTKEQPAT